MRRVTLITDVVTEEVMCGEYVEMLECQPINNVTPIIATDQAIATETKVRVPVHRLHHNHKRLLYAYSPRVQEMLKMPFDVLSSDLEKSRRRNSDYMEVLDRYKKAGFFARLKYLFTRRID